MFCCSNCYTSVYLRTVIESDPRIGECNFCNSTNVSIYEPRELIVFFRNILNSYQIDEGSKKTIIEVIDEDFPNQIFSEIVTDKLQLLRNIVIDEIDEFNDVLTKGLKSLNETKSPNEHYEIIHGTWERFKNEIKSINRFHITNTINLKKLKSLFENEAFHSIINKGKIFYRSRISDNQGFPPEEMWNPLPEIARAGRANPKGISYLYLADSPLTSIYEARATLFDYVSVADFRLIHNIKILNLRQPTYDPISWAEQEAIDDFLIYVPFIKTLQKELSLPIRSLDKEIDYLPTQYLSEFIKSLGFDGVEFQSSMYPMGYNLAIFNPEKFECRTSSVYEIENITLNCEKIAT